MGAPAWTYEVDEQPKRKHHWDRDEPGFVKVGGVPIGKCPRRLAPGPELQQRLESLLRSGIPWYPRRGRRDFPKRIYIVHEGWLYRATPTVPGRSYHAFPEDWQGRDVPPSLHAQIRERAEQLGCRREIEQWLS